jgi:hypothetical protein
MIRISYVLTISVACLGASVLGTNAAGPTWCRLSARIILGMAAPASERVRPMSTSVSQLATAALDTLHGARSLPPADAIAKLRDFLESIDTSVPDSLRLADASSALKVLISELEMGGAATNDHWERAIETTLSLANEAS